MKIPIDIPDPVLDEARKLAARKGVTLGALVELGLRRIISEKKSAGAFRLRKASFKGKGLQPAAKLAGWGSVRSAAYRGRGG